MPTKVHCAPLRSHTALLPACSYVYDENNRPQKRPPAEEITARASWKALYAGTDLDTEDFKFKKELRQAIMKGEVLPHIQKVSCLEKSSEPIQQGEQQLTY